MPFRFRKSFRLFPGLRLNVSKGGVSVSAGVPGATYNFGSRGSSVTLGIPGSGLSYRQQLSTATTSGAPHEIQPTYVGADAPFTDIASAPIAALTSPDLQGLKAIIVQALQQQAELKPILDDALRERVKRWRKLQRRQKPPLSYLFASSVSGFKEQFEEAEENAKQVACAYEMSNVKLQFDLPQPARIAWTRVVELHRILSQSQRIWDVTAERRTDKASERTDSEYVSRRKLVSSYQGRSAGFISDVNALIFKNANGSDLEILPGILLMRSALSLFSDSDFAFIELKKLDVFCCAVQFAEVEGVPSDSEVVGYAWEKSNVDGSRDKRFTNNRQIPRAQYGKIHFRTNNGVSEIYHVSNYEAANAFVSAINDFKAVVATSPKIQQSETLPAGSEGAAVATLPPLPAVSGAYEVYLIPLALAAVASWGVSQLLVRPSDSPSYARKGEPVEVPAVQPSQPSGAVAAQLPNPKVIPAPPAEATTRQETPSQTNPNAPSAFPKAELQPVPDEQRPGSLTDTRLSNVVVLQRANIRASSDRGSSVVKIVPPGTRLHAFLRRGDWVQVGDAEPVGWIHSSLVRDLR